jgi:hypothetical protein
MYYKFAVTLYGLERLGPKNNRGQVDTTMQYVYTAWPKYQLTYNILFENSDASQFTEWYNSVLNCALNMEDLISNNCYMFSK